MLNMSDGEHISGSSALHLGIETNASEQMVQLEEV